MEPEPLIAVPPGNESHSQVRFVFFNERGLRAGWRLAIFIAMLVAFTSLATLVLSHLIPRGKGGPPQGGGIQPGPQLITEFFSFLVILFFTWVMSRIEKRKIGVYGLRLQRPAFSSFIVGWVFWGFLPLTILLVVMRGLNVFYFGGLALHGAEILRFASLWGLVFLCVGLFEEYLLRGYVLYTLGDGIGFWPAAIVLAAGFGYLHASNPGETRIGLIDVCLFAMFAATTLRLTGNLWLAVGAHAGWDWGQSFFYGVNDSGATAVGHLLNSHAQGADWLSGGSVGPEGSVLSSLLLVLMTIAFVAVYGKRRERTTVVSVESSALPPAP